MPTRPDLPPLILASRSPRRATLLKEAGFRFTQADPTFEDPPKPDDDGSTPATQVAAELARQKALSTPAPDGALVLAADTICVDDYGKLIGKPLDAENAREMIKRFTNRSHQVITGVAIWMAGENDVYAFADSATVRLGTLSRVQLDEYLNTDQWQGKAGGYNLFDRQAAGWPLTVTGDPSTVVGLPMQRVAPALAERGIVPDTDHAAEPKA